MTFACTLCGGELHLFDVAHGACPHCCGVRPVVCCACGERLCTGSSFCETCSESQAEESLNPTTLSPNSTSENDGTPVRGFRRWDRSTR